MRLIFDGPVSKDAGGSEGGEDEEDYMFLKKFEASLLSQLTLRGVEGVTRVFMRQPKRDTVDELGASKTMTSNPYELDISDPFYASSAADGEALQVEISDACAGLVRFLEQVEEVPRHKSASLCQVVAENLRSNDLAIGEEGAFARNPGLLRSLTVKRQQSKAR